MDELRVYLVVHDLGGMESENYGVFSTRELAEAAIERWLQDKTIFHNYARKTWDITEYVVDEPPFT